MVSMKDEKQEEIYKQLEYYIINKAEKDIKILLKKHSISYFKHFRKNGYGIMSWFLSHDLGNPDGNPLHFNGEMKVRSCIF